MVEDLKMVTCNKCGWVSMSIPRTQAEDEVKKFNAYYETLDKKNKKEYYGGTGSSLDFYEHCHRCGGDYKDFRPMEVGDCPSGSTLNPVIRKED